MSLSGKYITALSTVWRRFKTATYTADCPGRPRAFPRRPDRFLEVARAAVAMAILKYGTAAGGCPKPPEGIAPYLPLSIARKASFLSWVWGPEAGSSSSTVGTRGKTGWYPRPREGLHLSSMSCHRSISKCPRTSRGRCFSCKALQSDWLWRPW